MNDMNIVVKNSDKLTSLLHSRKIVEEYLVYLLDGDTLVSAEVVYGEGDKDKYVTTLFNQNSKEGDNLRDVVTEVPFADYCKNYKN